MNNDSHSCEASGCVDTDFYDAVGECAACGKVAHGSLRHTLPNIDHTEEFFCGSCQEDWEGWRR